ncbi:MAG: hypothetical protein ACRERD_34810 [Candidatus Binatia bacterium]
MITSTPGPTRPKTVASARSKIRFKDWKGIRRSFPGGDNRPTALERRDQLLRDNRLGYDFDTKPAALCPTFAERGKLWLKLAKTLKHSYRRDVHVVLVLREYFGNKRLNEITASDIEAYKQQRFGEPGRLGRPPTPATINRELQLLRAILRLAKKDRLLTDVPEISLFPENNERSRLPTPDEYHAILEKLPAAGDMRATWILTAETGMRIGSSWG